MEDLEQVGLDFSDMKKADEACSACSQHLLCSGCMAQSPSSLRRLQLDNMFSGMLHQQCTLTWQCVATKELPGQQWCRLDPTLTSPWDSQDAQAHSAASVDAAAKANKLDAVRTPLRASLAKSCTLAVSKLVAQ